MLHPMSGADDLDGIGDAPDHHMDLSDSLLNTSRKGKIVGASRQKAYDMAE